MIPNFPTFKKLSLSDRRSVEAMVAPFEPYSNYNFENLWVWDYDNVAKISKLNGNLVIICSDHTPKKLSTNFLGNNRINETLADLFKFLKNHHLAPVLQSVPKISVQGADPEKYEIISNRSSYDYLYDLNSLAYFTEPKYSHKRKAANQFIRKFSKTELRVLNLNSKKTKSDIASVNLDWLNHKVNKTTKKEFKYESAAIDRFIDGSFPNSLTLGLYIGQKLVAYSFFSLLKDNFALCQFSKADTSFYGIYEHLMRESSKYLISKGYNKLNYEEDLGIDGLRQAKLSYKPFTFLEKYNVTEF